MPIIPRREAIIASLIQYKLVLRRFYRSCRRAVTSNAPPTTLHTSANDKREDDHDDDALRSRPRRPGQLPAPMPDRDPVPTPLIYAGLFIAALLLRLWRIHYPPSVVFDEVHFLRFVRAYYMGEYYFDIHPPLGKLILLAVTYIFCGPPEHSFKRNGESFKEQKYVPLRVTSALFGAAVPPLTYAIARQMGLSVWASLFAAAVQVVEHLSMIESRLVLMDAQLMAFMALCLYCALRMWSKPPGKRWSLVIATALSGAAALSVKWTSLTTPALVAIVSLIGLPFPQQPLRVEEIGVAGGIAITFYTFMFWIHFRLLPKSGRGDPFMRREFQETLIGNKFYKKDARGPGFFVNFLYLNFEMYVANKGIKARHRWESKWWQWIINKRGLLYHNEPKTGSDDEAFVEKIYLIVNPAVTVITCVSLLTFVIFAVVWAIRKWRRKAPVKKSIERRRTEAFIVRGWFLFSGYIFNILPYIEVARCTFLYHYLPALFYAILSVSNLIDVIPSLKVQRVVFLLLFAFVLTAFIIWKPWIYSSSLFDDGHKWRQLYGESWK